MAHDLVPRALPDVSDGEGAGLGQVVVDTVIPLLRGWLHLVCFFLSLPAGLVVVASARSPRAQAAALVYATGLSALFGVSAAYHRRQWSATARARMKRVDHATIFVMIAASSTPLCLLALSGGIGGATLLMVWVGAGMGVVLAATGIAEKPVIGLASYIVLGWMMALTLPELGNRLSAAQLVLLVAGGLLYTVGGVFLGTRWPDPFPRVFGYHELWHLMVVAAAACHYVAILEVVNAGA